MNEDRLRAIARTLRMLEANDLIGMAARVNLRSAAFLIEELARYDGTTFDTPRLMHAVNNVRNNQA